MSKILCEMKNKA